MIQKILCVLWHVTWKHRMDGDDFKVIKVRGWRTALIENRGSRSTITPMFSFENC